MYIDINVCIYICLVIYLNIYINHMKLSCNRLLRPLLKQALQANRVVVWWISGISGASAKALQWSAALLGTDGLGGALQPDVISYWAGSWKTQTPIFLGRFFQVVKKFAVIV